jgi:hypothetical protein
MRCLRAQWSKCSFIRSGLDLSSLVKAGNKMLGAYLLLFL